MRLLFRFVGVIFFIAGLALLARDLFHWFMDGKGQMESLAAVWRSIHAGSLDATSGFLARWTGPVWDPGLVWVLARPGFAVLLVLGLVLLLVTKRRRVESRWAR